MGWFSTFLTVAIPYYFLKWLFSYAKYRKSTKIYTKVAIITGGNTGIGKQTAIDLLQRGGKVYIGCRDIQRGEDAVTEIKLSTGSADVHFLQLDLASMDSIREFSRKFHEREHRLDILINNAGVMGPKQKTKDGFDMTFGVNHLGHFLLTNLMLDLLKYSAPSRVIAVSSKMHRWGKIDRNDLMNDVNYSVYSSYANSKLANVLFANELSKRLKGTEVTVNSCDPGLTNTEMTRNMGFQKYLYLLISPWTKTAEQGAQTQIRLAVDPDLSTVTGKYFAECEEAKTSKAATDEETASWLFNKSMELVKL